MEDRLRRLERNYREIGGVEEHAQLLAGLWQTGYIDEKRLIVAAFLGHKASRLAAPHIVNRNGVVFNERIIKNIEIQDYVRNLSVWGFKVTWRAGLGIARIINSQLQVDTGQNKLLSNLEDFVLLNSQKSKNFLRRMTRSNSWFHQRNRQRRIRALFNSICYLIGTGCNPIRPMVLATTDYPDKQIKKAIRKELYPFLLGEYK